MKVNSHKKKNLGRLSTSNLYCTYKDLITYNRAGVRHKFLRIVRSGGSAASQIIGSVVAIMLSLNLTKTFSYKRIK